MKNPYRYLKTVLAASMAAASLVLPLAHTTQVEAQEAIKVGILQYVEHDSLDAARNGFIDGLAEAGYVEGDNLTLNYLNAGADNANLQSMAETLGNGNDYVFAIATPAAQSVANAVTDIPVYFSAVTDPVDAGLVESLEAPGKNITGTIDAGPIKEQVDLLLSIEPEAEKIGIIYNSGETNSQGEANKAIEYLEELGKEVVLATVTSTNDISQVMGTLVKEADAIFTVTDNTIASAMPLVGDLAKEAGLAIVGGSKDMIIENGLATYGLDYYELGKQTAQMLVKQIEEGLDTAAIPVESAAVLELVVNEDYAEAIGIDPTSIQAPASSNEENNNEESTADQTSEEDESAE